MLSLVIKALPGGSRSPPTWFVPLQEEAGIVAGMDSGGAAPEAEHTQARVGTQAAVVWFEPW